MGSEAEGSESEESVDLDNLPEDLVERFEILGIDASLADCGDEMLIRVSEESAIMEIVKRQEDKRKARTEKEATKRAEQ